MINRERLIGEFIALTEFDCESFAEKEIAAYLRKELDGLGLEVFSDSAENIFAVLPATRGFENKEAVLFSAHMDTVKPGIGKKAVRHADGRISSDGTTVLGADDAAGLAEIVEALRAIKEEGLPHGRVEIVFFAAEEPYCWGSSVFDPSVITAKYGYVLDLTGKVGTAAISAPTIMGLEVSVKGKSAHAGFEPETGINALSVAAAALSKIPAGRTFSDGENATLNFGIVNGGTAPNIVPEEIRLSGEIRSLDDGAAEKLCSGTKQVFLEEAGKLGASVDFKAEKKVKAYRVPENGEAAEKFIRAAKKTGLEPVLTVTYGGSDANRLNEWGIPSIVLANAMMNVHTVSEYTEEEEMYAAAKLVLLLMNT